MNAWKNWGAHALGYALAALPIIQQFAPAVVPGYGAAIAAGAGAALLIVHNIQTVAAANASPVSVSTTVKAALPLVLGLLLVGGATSLTGCSVLSKLSTPAAQPYITAAVDVAVATAEQKGIPAAQINSICKVALAADSSTSATLATVASAVNAQLAKLNLPAGDLAAAQILEDALSVAIQAQVGANPNLATAQTAIANVLNAAIAATGG